MRHFISITFVLDLCLNYRPLRVNNAGFYFFKGKYIDLFHKEIMKKTSDKF